MIRRYVLPLLGAAILLFTASYPAHVAAAPKPRAENAAPRANRASICCAAF